MAKKGRKSFSANPFEVKKFINEVSNKMMKFNVELGEQFYNYFKKNSNKKKVYSLIKKEFGYSKSDTDQRIFVYNYFRDTGKLIPLQFELYLLIGETADKCGIGKFARARLNNVRSASSGFKKLIGNKNFAYCFQGSEKDIIALEKHLQNKFSKNKLFKSLKDYSYRTKDTYPGGITEWYTQGTADKMLDEIMIYRAENNIKIIQKNNIQFKEYSKKENKC